MLTDYFLQLLRIVPPSPLASKPSVARQLASCSAAAFALLCDLILYFNNRAPPSQRLAPIFDITSKGSLLPLLDAAEGASARLSSVYPSQILNIVYLCTESSLVRSFGRSTRVGLKERTAAVTRQAVCFGPYKMSE